MHREAFAQKLLLIGTGWHIVVGFDESYGESWFYPTAVRVFSADVPKRRGSYRRGYRLVAMLLLWPNRIQHRLRVCAACMLAYWPTTACLTFTVEILEQISIAYPHQGSSVEEGEKQEANKQTQTQINETANNQMKKQTSKQANTHAINQANEQANKQTKKQTNELTHEQTSADRQADRQTGSQGARQPGRQAARQIGR